MHITSNTKILLLEIWISGLAVLLMLGFGVWNSEFCFCVLSSWAKLDSFKNWPPASKWKILRLQKSHSVRHITAREQVTHTKRSSIELLGNAKQALSANQFTTWQYYDHGIYSNSPSLDITTPDLLLQLQYISIATRYLLVAPYFVSNIFSRALRATQLLAKQCFSHVIYPA